MNDTSRALSDADLRLLDPVLRVVAKAGGLDAAMRLSDALGGVFIFVPENPTADCALAQVVGLPAVVALKEEFGRGYLRPGKAGRFLRSIRDRQMLMERGDKSLRELALQHRLTQRRVLQIMRADREADEACGQLTDDQPDLFG